MFSSWAWGQFAVLFWVAVCLFAAGARGKGIPMTAKTWGEIAQAAVIVVMVFALASEGRGCANASTAGDASGLCSGDAPCP
jgi:hypothetical protein